MRKKILTCIVCPLSCNLEIIIGNNKSVKKIEGSRCFRGIKYATDEIKNPLRTIITVIKVKNGEIPTVSVKTSKPIPKGMIQKVMENTSKLEVEAPTEIGQTIKGNIDDIEFIVTRKVKRLAG